MRRSAVIPFVVACLIAFGWDNQGISSARVDARLAELDPHSATDRVRGAVLNLFRRSNDEAIYYAVANATRGLPYDFHLTFRGESMPGWFSKSPPPDGRWHAPYTEVPTEYPIANLPVILLPSFGATGFEGYAFRLGLLMASLLIAAAALAIRAQPGRDVGERWWSMAALLFAQGGLAVQRLDALTAFLLAWTLWAAAERRHATTGVALGLATGVKLLPSLLVPPLALADREAWRTRPARLRGALGFAFAVSMTLGPMLLIPGALSQVLRYHNARGLHVESTFATLLGIWRLLTGTSAAATLSFGSFNLDGPTASGLARVCMPMMVLSFAGLALGLLRAEEPGDDVSRRDRLALTLLAGVAALWLSAKVFSPQYLTWAIPLVLAVSGARGRRLTVLLFAILLVTQIYQCGHYETVIAQTALGIGSLALRLALIVAFTVMVAGGLLTRRRPLRPTRPGS